MERKNSTFIKIFLVSVAGTLVARAFGGVPVELGPYWVLGWALFGPTVHLIENVKARLQLPRSDHLSLIGHVPEKEVDRAE